MMTKHIKWAVVLIKNYYAKPVKNFKHNLAQTQMLETTPGKSLDLLLAVHHS